MVAAAHGHGTGSQAGVAAAVSRGWSQLIKGSKKVQKGSETVRTGSEKVRKGSEKVQKTVKRQ